MVFMKRKCNKAGKAFSLMPLMQQVLNKWDPSSLKIKELYINYDSSTMDQDVLAQNGGSIYPIRENISPTLSGLLAGGVLPGSSPALCCGKIPCPIFPLSL